MIEEPESFLSRLRSLVPATPGHGTPADFGALANLVHMSARRGGPDSPILIGDIALSLTKGNVERMLLDAKAVWLSLPEIIEALDWIVENGHRTNCMWVKRLGSAPCNCGFARFEALLPSKVSQPNA